MAKRLQSGEIDPGSRHQGCISHKTLSAPPMESQESLGCKGELPHLALGGVLQVCRKPYEAQQFHRIPSEVHLPPLQAVPTRGLERVVVVVPTLAEGQDPDEPVVHGVVARVPILEAPDVADGVHCPSDVPNPADASEESPHHARHAAEGVEA
eukprot:CAMPEP_0204529160 /NCGR_PEP_ID=MMETSP0661-20131031/9910_1 /ASSEMBLY_ACC=CAM_ASM_000606 /TAXON_ID=109239 /ORGANISM="Alexandrium margalefi, Strain AMGDE01CS-322" /LENGTH=152 /DNA_ID=CAMNT_0051535171 /DNA_START=371 /DNA_END=830 /DNA_ORIENTATION=+